MTGIEQILKDKVTEALRSLYRAEPGENGIQIQKTRKEFTGDYTIIVFPLTRYSKKGAAETGREIGEYLVKEMDGIRSFDTVKGFLNIEFTEAFWLGVLQQIADTGAGDLLRGVRDTKTIVVEYSSPNTNKPLHLGHIRNNLIGHSIAGILEAVGNRVFRVNIVNDRGIHICKSMLAWQKWGGGATPENTGRKGDHLVGDYYVRFEQELKKQVNASVKEGMNTEEARKNAPLLVEAQEMLRKWEAGDRETIRLWKTMNSWVYQGFDKTYEALGVKFDKIYYESDTFKLGRSIVLDALKKGIFLEKPDGSVWADLTGEGLDEKILLRADGTAVYITQDLGTAVLRHKDYRFDKQIYVVGNEQEYHFRVLSLVLEKAGYPWAKDLYHLSYGMVELPEGKMKSREGTTVDADDLISEMIDTARDMSKELGKLDSYSDGEKQDIYRKIGLGALKYFILKVDPRKNMTFDPKESIDFNGNTGPFIQYTYSRIRSVLRKVDEMGLAPESRIEPSIQSIPKEIALIKLLHDYPLVVKEAAWQYNPGLIANFCYEVAREFNQFYHDFPIIRESNPDLRNLRIMLSETTGILIASAMEFLGIEVPERM